MKIIVDIETVTVTLRTKYGRISSINQSDRQWPSPGDFPCLPTQVSPPNVAGFPNEMERRVGPGELIGAERNHNLYTAQTCVVCGVIR